MFFEEQLFLKLHNQRAHPHAGSACAAMVYFSYFACLCPLNLMFMSNRKKNIYNLLVSAVAFLCFQVTLYTLQQPQQIAETKGKHLAFKEVQKQLHFETFYAIFSAPSEIEQRNIWRTEGLWSNRCLEHFSNNNISLVYRFVLGHEAIYDLKLYSEQERYNDLIILDMHDRYRNLTRKLGTLMEWSTFDCPFTFDTMLRMDMDAFPNPFRVQEYARTLPSMTVSGFVWKQASAIREPDHKWRDLDYPLETYFPYPNGPSYFITKDVVNYLGREHRQGILRYYANEDSTMGTWIGSRTVNLIHDTRIGQMNQVTDIGCTDEMVTSSDINMQRHVDMSLNLLLCGNPCQCD